ncbi:NACHT domain-containing protein [Streptomyces tsukubensis]|uniref:NACHT domain-containing protein n=1 Tax=Streptomyces tsukubensis TaxID=83656 RepID=UPI00344E63E4
MRNGPSMRVVAVLGSQQGTGVLLTPRHVLTCAHVLNGRRGGPSVLHLTSSRPFPCDVVKVWPGRDAVLLRAGEDIVSADRLGRLRIAALTRDDPLHHIQTTGFPGQQRYGGNKLDFGQYTGTVLPAAGQARGALTLWLDHTPGPPSPDGRSPLAGLSGAPVLAGPVLLGIVAKVSGVHGQQLEAVPIDALASWAFGSLPAAPRLERMSGFDPADAPFEERYADAVKAQYGKTEIFGIDELGVSESSWDLDTAYLSLEATGRDEELRRGPGKLSAGIREPLPDEPPAVTLRDYDDVVGVGVRSGPSLDDRPRRVEQLLGRSNRILLRGEAGAGKTTLVWWLAAHAACGTLPTELDGLNGLVPLVVPMRSLRRLPDQKTAFPAPDELGHVAGLAVGRAPDGWAERILESGRGFLLVDGVDELPQDDRDRARAWLTRLLARYPDTRCLATVRPGAVERDWLTGEGFTDLLLLPMSDDDITAFVAAWHRAAHLEYAGRDQGRATAEARRLDELRQQLTREFTGNRVLRDLARTPLLCAVICALHRKRRGRLPHTRWELYRATLDMLLGKRDRDRGIDAPEGLNSGVDEHRLLLQHIAVWLVRCGRTQFTPDEAVQRIDQATGYMPQVREQAGARRILAHLINRSGLLQQCADDAIQFIHRTFQDYLAAKELAETDSVGEIVIRAGDELWRDVILLSVGHLDRRVGRLVNGLIDKVPRASGPEDRALLILAGQCAANAVFLDAGTRARAEEAVRSVMPPRNEREVQLLAELGDYVLPLLPGPSGHSQADQLIVDLYAMVGAESAIPRLRAFVGSDHLGVRMALAEAWSGFPAQRYAHEVLSRVPLTDVPVSVTVREQLALLKSLGPITAVSVFGSHTSAELHAGLPESGLTEVVLSGNPVLTDLHAIAERRSIRYLAVQDCPALISLSTLSDHGFITLTLDARTLNLPGNLPMVDRLHVLGEQEVPYRALDRWKPRCLLLSAPARLSALIEAANRIPSLHDLRMQQSPELDDPAVPSARIDRLELRHFPSAAELDIVARAFPALRTLQLAPAEPPPHEIDLTPLHTASDRLCIDIFYSDLDRLRLIGHEHFGDRLTLPVLTPLDSER